MNHDQTGHRRGDRPGIEEVTPERRPLLRRGDVVFGLLVGLVVSAVLVAVIPDARTHMFGGTELRETTVIDVREGARAGDSDRAVTTYVLRWEDTAGAHSTTFKRSGPPRRDVGQTWELWVSKDGATVETDSPLATWLALGLGVPLASLLIGLLWQWRQRVFVRAALRGIDRKAERQARKDAR